MANSAMSNLFTTTVDSFGDKTHFLWGQLYQEKVDPFTSTLLIHSELKYLPLTSINAPVALGCKFQYLFLVPDSKALAEE